MIKLTLNELVNAESIIVKLDDLSKKGQLQFSATYKLGRIIKKIQPELTDFYQEREKFLKKFGEEVKELKTPEGKDTPEEVGTGRYKVVDEKNFAKYMTALVNTEVELTNVFPFKVEELAGLTDLSLDDMFRFDKFVEKVDTEAEQPRKKIEIAFEEETDAVEVEAPILVLPTEDLQA